MSDKWVYHEDLVERDERDRIAREICDSEAFMWLMTSANHPDVHLKDLKRAYHDHYLPAGGGYGSQIPK